MTPEFRIALTVSMGAHAALLVGWFAVNPAAMDVERGRSSMELHLIAHEALSPGTLAAEEIHEEPSFRHATALPAEASASASVDEQGALTEMEMLPEYVKNVPPRYPRVARERGDEGTVMLELEVLASGRPGTVTILYSSGHELLDQAAVAAVRGWVFRPARRFQKPVPFWVEIPITFRLADYDTRGL